MSELHDNSANPSLKEETEKNSREVDSSSGSQNDGSENLKQSKRATAQDLLNTRPPTFKDRIQRFFFLRGLGDRPEYMQEIYNNIPRTIFFNYDLPTDMKDDKGHPIIEYPRNKIRTTKYTPITFLPKNLLLQFTNVANTYFLILVILSAFQVFGVPSPGLAAVPLIVIVCITAVKDAFEDYRRVVSDLELNNSPIHLLCGVLNPNVEKDFVGPWRRFKKSCTKATIKTFKGIKKACIYAFGNKRQKQDFIREQAHQEDLALHRVSTVVSDYSYHSQQCNSIYSPRNSTYSPRISTQSRNRKSTQSRHPPTKALPNSLLNPVLKEENTHHPDMNRASFKNRYWKDVNVGDMIRIRADEEVPADVVIISTSDAEGNCYVETKNLDGETNLKTRTALKCGGNNNLKHSDDLSDTKFWLECDSPNPDLYSFRGTIHYENYDGHGNLVNHDEKEVITPENVLLRGCVLRNSKWVIGLCVYTGRETKIMLNAGITPTKISRISRELNLSVIINFILLFVLCFISGLVNGLFYRVKDNSRVYFDWHPYGSTPAARGVIAFFVALIIYQSLVPISLYISIEIIKTLQAFFIHSDVKMYYPKLDFPCIPKAWNISDDLGQIEYVFSDKTGTLTQNVMEFRKCTINGKSYGLAYTEAKQGLDKRQGLDVVEEGVKWKQRIADDKQLMLDNLHKFSNNDQLRDDNIAFVSNKYVEDTLLASLDDPQRIANEKFMFALALCHTVVTEQNKDDPELRDFKAESPDEAALVAVARDLGIVFKAKLRQSLLLLVYGKEEEFQVLNIIPFTSARKRMSCIVRTPNGDIVLYTKGADSVIFQRLDSEKNPQELVSKTALYLEDYANEGLRTLCIASRKLDPKHYENWAQKYHEAVVSIEDNREDLIDELNDAIERDLVLLGGTAIEDRLQPGVPDSIAILGQAGIKLWVLTGDRIETAINIGFSCDLLENSMKLLVVRPDESNPMNVEYIDELISKHLSENFQIDASSSEAVESLITKARKDHSPPSSKYALIIDGAALGLIFQDLDTSSNENMKLIKDKFLLLGKQCKSVMCCRVSPAQKAEVVRIVKTRLKVMTLAIGDGANDVAMIQTANVGVGIAGEEGRQAANSSDYAIGQFRFLTRLLLVHGRWSYKRLAEMVPCFFYKNVVFSFTFFWYGIYNNYDGSYLYEYTYLMFYNLAFTSLPVIVLGVLDQDVSDTVSLLVPQLYINGILSQDWSQYKFVMYMVDGLYQSVISFYFPFLLFYKAFQNPQGMTIDHRFYVGIVAACISVTACDLYVLLRQYRWDWLSLLIDAISILLVYFWTGVWSVNKNYSGEFYRAGAQTLGTLGVWCCIFIAVIACLLPRFTLDFLRTNFKPTDIDIIREQVRQGKYDDYPEGYDPTDADDVEKHRLLTEIIKQDPKLLDMMEKEYEEDKLDHENKFERTFKSIKRKTTLTSSRSQKHSQRLRKNTINRQFHKPMSIDELRQQMIQTGEYNTARNSLERISTSHAVPGLTQAETLLSYHTRNSINLNRGPAV